MSGAFIYSEGEHASQMNGECHPFSEVIINETSFFPRSLGDAIWEI